MSAEVSPVWILMQTIAAGDTAKALQMLTATPWLASERLGAGASRERAFDFFLESITHYAYSGDTCLHIAAAAYQLEVARALVAARADVQARNRRGAEPIHYAADGVPGGEHWNPQAQAQTIVYLVAAGADPNATDGSMVRPLHRAVRTRCASAVRALLDSGADPSLANGNGSTPLDLAKRQTGRGGSGGPQAKAEQAAIIRLLESSKVR
jgi:ankyrin repeat protein